jgi:hypothetical protein
VKFHLQEKGRPYALLQLKVRQPIQIILQVPHSEGEKKLFTIYTDIYGQTNVNSVSPVRQNPSSQGISLP